MASVKKLHFLGTAQDGGVPQVGCNCVNCCSINQTAASIALIDHNEAIIIDVTPDLRNQYRALCNLFGKVRLKAIYLTHAHWGHYGGLMQLGKEGWNVQNLPIYLSQQFFDFLSSNDPFASLFSDNHLIPHIIENKSITEHGLTAHSVDHRNEYSDTFAYLFDLNGKRTLYMPDIDSINDEIDRLVRSMHLSIIDATFYNDSELPHRKISEIPHPFVNETIERFSDIPEQIVLTHFNHSNPLLNINCQLSKQLLDRGFRIAIDGLTLI